MYVALQEKEFRTGIIYIQYVSMESYKKKSLQRALFTFNM